jgi:hypothetical protein
MPPRVTMLKRPLVSIAVLGLAVVSCSSTGETTAPLDGAPTTAIDEADDPGEPTFIEVGELPRGELRDFGPAPVVPHGDLAPDAAAAIQTIFGTGSVPDIFTDEQNEAIRTLGASEDPRVTWILMDMFRFAQGASRAQLVVDAANELTGLDVSVNSAWGDTTDRLIAWDVAEPPDYVDVKRVIYSSVLPEWGPLFNSPSTMDWRYVSWGGVRIDDRPFDTTDDPCNCIPAADNPETQPAGEATWIDDDDVVFGVVVNGDARAYPRQIMEVREMVNDTLGGRDFAMPYCTLCGSAQVFFTDEMPVGVDRPVLRTSGLLSRSNKVMFDLNTFSVFDTFLGTAQTGPLAELGIELPQHSVVTSSWSAWKTAHPETDVLVESLALGRDFDFRNGRDADGPIFPIGDVDPRLPVQEDVLGVVKADGTPLAFHVPSAHAVLDRGETVEIDGIRVIKDGGGLKAQDAEGNDLGSHQAFWFAWSQFYKNTELWPS